MKRIIIIIILLFVIYQQNFAQVVNFPVKFNGKWTVYEPVPALGAILENCSIEVKLLDEMTLVMTTDDKVDTFDVERIAITMEQGEYLIAIAIGGLGETRIFLTHNSMMIADTKSSQTVCFRDRPTAYRYLKTVAE